MTESREFFLKAASLLTGQGLVRNKALHIKNGIISGFPDDYLINKTANVLDYPDHVITPCFCDYHLHFFNDSPEFIAAIARDLITSGIKSVLEGGDKHLTGLKLKNQLQDRLNIKSAGCAIYKKGTYGQFIGKGVKNVSEASELINQLHREEVDYIKIINSGIFDPETGEITPGGFERRELKDIVGHAKDRDLKVACHANGDQAVRDAVDAGASYIIHGLHVSDDTLSEMAAKGTSFVPTVNAFMSLHSIATDKESRENIREAVEIHVEAVGLAYVKGVKLLPGSDSGPACIPYGKAYQDELYFWQRAGIPIEHILSSAAVAPFKQGQKADFLVLDGLEVKKYFIDGI